MQAVLRQEKEYRQYRIVDTTVGELVAAVSDAALQMGESEEESYLIAVLALDEIMKWKVRGRNIQFVV